MEHPKQTQFTADEFIAWALEQPTGRYELVDGIVVAMASERVGHARAKLDAVIALRTAVRAGGLGCEAFPDGMAVRVDDRNVFEPDALVRCGPPLPDDAVELTDPVIIVEVLSPSTQNVDSGRKLEGYFALASLCHYLVVDTVKRFVLHYTRVEGDAISLRILRDGPIPLDPPGLAIEVRDLFASL